jgi:hypothetical protein
MPMLPYSDDNKARFADFAELYLACRAAFRDISEQTPSRPAPNSYADRDTQSLLARNPPIAQTAEHLIAWVVRLYLYAASEHIGGLAALYACEEVLVAPIVLARCALEHSAHAIWIIGDPNQDAQDRLARAFLEEIFGAEQAKMQAGRLLERSSEEHRRRTEHYGAVTRDAEFTFEPPHQNDKGRPMLRGHVMPSPEEIVLHMNRVSTQPLPDNVMSGTYGFLSNYVHPTPYPLRELFAVRDRDDQRVPELRRDLEFHERLTKLVVIPFYHALTYVASYQGWAPDRHKQLSDDIDRLLPDVFVDGPSPAPFDLAS